MKQLPCFKQYVLSIALEIYNNNDLQLNRHDFTIVFKHCPSKYCLMQGRSFTCSNL